MSLTRLREDSDLVRTTPCMPRPLGAAVQGESGGTSCVLRLLGATEPSPDQRSANVQAVATTGSATL